MFLDKKSYQISRRYLLFDYDGVVVKQADFAGDVSTKYGLNEESLRAFFAKHLIDCLKGKQDIVELLSTELHGIGWDKDAISLFRAIYTNNQIYDNDLIEYIRTTLLPKYHCYIATNQDSRRYELIKNTSLIKGLFRKVYCSSELGTSKPETSYFEKVYSRLSEEEGEINKEQVIFIDDSIENIKSAELFGLNIHYYVDFEGFKLSMIDWLSGRAFPSLKVGEFELAKMKLSHSKGYSEILSEPDKHHFLTESGPIDENSASLKIMRNRNLFLANKSIYWSILGRKQEFTGFIGVHNYRSSKVYISYGIHPDYRRRGIASTVLKELLKWKELDGKTKVLATHLENTASFKMLRKLRLTYKGIQRMGQGERHVFEA